MSPFTTFFIIVGLLCSITSLIEGQSEVEECRSPQPPPYNPNDIEAYHFHTYFYAQNPASVKEVLAFRNATRQQIEAGFLPDCSLNKIKPNVDGPHPYSQYELCCNKSSVAQSTAWHMQNHGNLSVLIHPLTREEVEDHEGRATWIGRAVPLDLDCEGCLVKCLPKAPICPIYPYCPDQLPEAEFRYMFP